MKFQVLFPHLDERQRRLLMGAEAGILGHGGIRAMAQAAEVSETTLRKGVDELEAGAEPLGRVRRLGGGRKRAAEVDPGLRPALLALVEPDMRGDPMITAAMDDEVHPQTRRRAHRVGPPGLGGYRRRPAEGGGVQPPGQRQDRRASSASRPGCPVPLHQRPGQRAYESRMTR